MTRSLVPTSACLFVAFAAFSVTASADLTAEFYQTNSQAQSSLFQSGQERPILAYECYRTGVTVEPEDTVNFTVLFDGTNPSNYEGYAITWAATNGSADSYDTGFVTFSYNNTNSAMSLEAPGLSEQAMVLVEPFNEFAYYFRFSVTSPTNKVVYKIYDVDSHCGNAAVLLRNIDQDGQQGFQFVRDVPQPTKTCTKRLLCAA